MGNVTELTVKALEQRIQYLERENAAQAEMLRMGRERAERLTEMIEQGIKNFNALAAVTGVIQTDDMDWTKLAVKTEDGDLVCGHCSAMLVHSSAGMYCPKCTVTK